MSGKTFIDTNVLIYAHDLDAKEKQTALKTGAERILSEDLNAGQKIAGIRVVNPFAHLK
jgi:predicted nucleic acid-binding protein